MKNLYHLTGPHFGQCAVYLIDHLDVSSKAIVKRSDDQNRYLAIGKILLILNIGIGGQQDIEAV